VSRTNEVLHKDSVLIRFVATDIRTITLYRLQYYFVQGKRTDVGVIELTSVCYEKQSRMLEPSLYANLRCLV